MIAMGNLHCEKQSYYEAVQMHQRVLGKQPENIEAMVGMANACYDLKKMRDATLIYERAIRLSSGNGMDAQ